MKLTYEDKVQIYELRKQGFSFPQLSDIYGIKKANLKYIVRLIERYGLEIVNKVRNNYYSPALKQEMIDKFLTHFLFGLCELRYCVHNIPKIISPADKTLQF